MLYMLFMLFRFGAIEVVEVVEVASQCSTCERLSPTMTGRSSFAMIWAILLMLMGSC